MDYAHTNLQLVAVHRPDFSNDRDENGTLQRNELPGDVVVGVDVDGAFIPLQSVKKSTFDTMVETARAQRESDEAAAARVQQQQGGDQSQQQQGAQQGGDPSQQQQFAGPSGSQQYQQQAGGYPPPQQ